MGINLSKEESLKKIDLRKKEVLNIVEKDESLRGLVSRAAVVMDFSGSMGSLYRNGTVQTVLERLLPVAMQFDDNGEMEVWLFDNGFRRMPNMNLDNFYGYVDREIMQKGYHMGGTCYAPVMQDIYNKYMKEDSANLPNYVMFITDGDNSDHGDTNRVITMTSHSPIFWQFVGLGNSSFSYLERLDTLSGRYVDNANFFALNDFEHVSDSELYKRLLNEYPQWLRLPQVQNMIANGEATAQNNSASQKKGFFGKLFG